MENQQKDLNPYEFTLEIDGEAKAIRVEVPKPGDYVVYINGERSGHIYPETGDTALHWRSKDKISQRLVNEIGAQVELLEKKTV
jgi:hypothetical protein